MFSRLDLILALTALAAILINKQNSLFKKVIAKLPLSRCLLLTGLVVFNTQPSWSAQTDAVINDSTREVAAIHITEQKTSNSDQGKLMTTGWWVAAGLALLLIVVIGYFQKFGNNNAIRNQQDEAIQQKLLKELAESSERNNAIMSSARHLVIAIDTEGIVTVFNHAAEVALGYSAEEVVGKQTPALWHSVDEIVKRAEELSKELGRTIEPGFEVFIVNLREGRIEDREWTFTRKDGTSFPASLIGTVMRNNQNEIIGYLGILEDITERKKVEQERQIYVEKLAQSNKELDAFAYVASHDLKAPLRVIDNASRWLEEDLGEQLEGDNLENLQLIRNRTLRMEKLLDDLLDYSRIGRKVDERYAAQMNGDELMQDVLLLVEKAEGFTINISDNFSGIKLNCMPIQQIFVNFINNAIKHHDKEKGIIDITLDEEREGKYIFSVKDDGPGIPEKFHKQVFEMFQTLKPRDRVEGSGMGLTIVKKHIENFGGEIALESTEGEGSIFRFSWPKQQN